LPEGYWKKKIERNVARDKENRKALKEKGWKVLRIWEHEVYDDFEATMNCLEDFLLG